MERCCRSGNGHPIIFKIQCENLRKGLRKGAGFNGSVEEEKGEKTPGKVGKVRNSNKWSG